MGVFKDAMDRVNARGARLEYRLRCDVCGDEDWYVVDLSAHGFVCKDGDTRQRNCTGKIVCVETRPRAAP